MDQFLGCQISMDVDIPNFSETVEDTSGAAPVATTTTFSNGKARFEIDNTERPAGHARYGQEIERFFGMYKTQWLALRPGNNAMYTENRAVSGSHTSAKSASLSIEDTWNEVNQCKTVKQHGD